MKLLITAGGTREPIDAVRFIANFSTGQTGAALSDYLAEQGHSVTHLGGMDSAKPRLASRFIQFESFTDLDRKLCNELASTTYDAVIHAAAVGDYSVDQVIFNQRSFMPSELTKIDSDADVTLKLKKNFKIVERLKTYAKLAKLREPLVIAFKLTHCSSQTERIQAIQKLSMNPEIDWVVHNDLSEVRMNGTHIFRIYQRGVALTQVTSSIGLAQSLHRLLNPQGRNA